MVKHSHSLLLFLALGSLPLPAQTLGPGKYIAGVLNWATSRSWSGEIYALDPVTRKATRLNVVGNALAKAGIYDLHALAPAFGFLVTCDPSNNYKGDLFSYTISGTNISLKKLNSSPFGGTRLGQIAHIGGTLYISAHSTSPLSGQLYSIPLSGGVPKLEATFPSKDSRANGYGCAVLGGKVYTATKEGQLWVFDPVTKKTKKVMDLPMSLSTISKLLPQKLAVDLKANQLIVMGVYGDVVWVDPIAPKVIRHVNCGSWNSRSNKYNYRITLSCAWNPDTGDVAMGNHFTSMDILSGSHGSLDFIRGIGTNTNKNNNFVEGLTYFPTGGACASYGDGGMGSGGYFPVNVSLGLPFAKGKWGLHLGGGLGGAPAILLMGISAKSWGPIPLPFDLGPLGAPGNWLRCSGQGAFGFVLSGKGNGAGEASMIFTLPPATLGGTFYSQWIVLDAQADPLGLVTSNARKGTVK